MMPIDKGSGTPLDIMVLQAAGGSSADFYSTAIELVRRSEAYLTECGSLRLPTPAFHFTSVFVPALA
jgi:hypothetical protein